jgi:hypothetical protein
MFYCVVFVFLYSLSISVLIGLINYNNLRIAVLNCPLQTPRHHSVCDWRMHIRRSFGRTFAEPLDPWCSDCVGRYHCAQFQDVSAITLV